ncbi:ribosomal protein S10 [Dentipellis sp. KUC8613]|nr:ribosomal protein S10 [Dentipellis sp. KUC8613]
MLAAALRVNRPSSCRSALSVHARWVRKQASPPKDKKPIDTPAAPKAEAAKPAAPAKEKEVASAVKKAVASDVAPNTTPSKASASASAPTPARAPAPAPAPQPIPAKPLRGVVLNPEELEYHATIVEGRSSLNAYRHPQTHGIPVASIHFRSFFPPLLNIFTHFASHAAASLGIPISGVASLPTQRTLWTVPRGPFVHKKSQENFQRKVHKRAIKAFDADPEVVDRWVKYLERHALAGVGLRVVRWHRVPVGVGKKQLENAIGQLRLDPVPAKDKVKALGKQIIAEETKAAQAQGQAASGSQ